MLNILSHQQPNLSTNIKYLVPFQWWQKIQQLNQELKDIKNLKIINPINLDEYIQTIESKQKDGLLKTVSQKVNFLQIDNLIINYKLKHSTKWKIISHSLYNIIKKQIGSSVHLPLFFRNNEANNQNQVIFIEPKMQFKLIKILLCSFTQNHLFYGYISKQIPLVPFIKELLTIFQYFYTEDTKITFLQTNQIRNYKFQQTSIPKQKQQQLIMIHGLQRYDQKIEEDPIQRQQTPQYYFSVFQSPRVNRIQRNGQELTMADEDSRTLTENTMSTGAQTPFTFNIEEQDQYLFRPYQNYGLFGQKLHEQIQHMKEYARQAIYTDITCVPCSKLETMINELEKLAEDLEENIQKRKMYQKQIVKDSKQYSKQLKQSLYLCHFRQKDSNFLHKEINAQSAEKLQIKNNNQKQISSELKVNNKCQKKQPIIHYVLQTQND